jgi:uncharacterized protein (DUF849 family)
MTFGREVVINTPKNLTRMAEVIYESGVKPELEVFDSGDLQLARDLIRDGVLRTPAMFSLVLGIKYGFPATPETMLFARSLLPTESVWIICRTSRKPSSRCWRRPRSAPSGPRPRRISGSRACSTGSD